ncbi:NnrS family protein [Shimia aestuarii]|uniref:NnrS family protein n=1 Tax=Shimia aestuarii TaxID=254406 RepID=UPI001041E1D2|nr:NnrS family protein [Shimia aestuarii]
MTSQNPTSDRVWPETGLWAASFRVMFPLAAVWAAISVGFWQWGARIWPNLEAGLAWHIHEMTFGFGGAALAGYLLTACSSWTGRAPVGGWRLIGIAALWIVARGLVLLDSALAAPLSTAFFWSVAGCLFWEAKKGGRQWRPAFITICLLAGVGSVLFLWRGEASTWPVLGFAALLVFVGGRMVPAFLFNAVGSKPVAGPWMTTALAFGVAVSGVAPREWALAVSGLLLVQVARWPVRVATRDTLLAILVVAYLWLPAGLLAMGVARALDLWPIAAGFHALSMGAMGGLIMAVSARAFAWRASGVLKARRGVGVAFGLVMTAVILRMGGWLDAAAGLWCAGWLIHLVVMLPHLHGPVPRPVFSGARGK